MNLDIEWLLLAISLELFASVVFFVSILSIRNFVGAIQKALFVLSLIAFVASIFSWLLVAGVSQMIILIGLVLKIAHVLNVARGIAARYKPGRIQRRLTTTWWRLVALELIVVLIAGYLTIDNYFLGTLAISCVLIVATIVNLVRFRAKHATKQTLDWPTVSLLIPARNEDNVLDDALNNYLALDYPKLEIIVLDDCSHDRTPQIIKSYAHDGVRFIPGNLPPEDWTGKNHALQVLLEEASGEYVVFCDADIRMSPLSLTKIISMMQHRKYSMISILPGRRHFDVLPNLVQSFFEYAPVLIPLEVIGMRPAVGSFMAFNASQLNQRGGFVSYADKVTPEYNLAKAIGRRQKYGFFLGSGLFDITTRKHLSSIIDTQVRTIYPLLQRDPAIALMVSAVLFGVYLVLPITALINQSLVAVVALGLLVLAHVLVTTVINPNSWFLSLINLPVIAITSISIILVSMFKYEFGTVKWKKRNICYTSLEVISKLPDIKRN